MSSQEQLQSLLNEDLCASNLARLIETCEEILATTENVLVVFTLRGLFVDLYEFFDRGPVEAEEARVLTDGIRAKVLALLGDIRGANYVSLTELICHHLSNKNALRKRRE